MPAFDFILAGRYRLVAPLGEGGMAAVYRGRDLRLNREVAIKILHDDLTHDPQFLARFQREAQMVASLSHPNIVPVYDVGEERGTHYIVMEYVRGRTLRDAIEMERRIAASRSVDIMVRILDALDYAHSQGLIHRDVKPHNILLGQNGTPRLADFGIARLVDGSTTRTAAILGSAQYLSPEQSRGEDATPQSDIYACGIVLYEMLAGRPPFDGSNALAIAHHHLHDAPPPLGSETAGIDSRLEAVVHRALAKAPTARFDRAAAFAGALRSLPPRGEGTDIQPLVSQERPVEKRAVSMDADDGSRMIIRRSGRKAYLLALILAGIVVAAAYAAQLPLWYSRLPAYPSAPYALLPAACALAALSFWISKRSCIYSMDANVAVVQWGLLAHRRLGVPLRQVVTLELKQSPLDRILGVGTVELLARDQHGREQRLVMEDVPRPRQTYDELIRLMSTRGARGSIASAGQS